MENLKQRLERKKKKEVPILKQRLERKKKKEEKKVTEEAGKELFQKDVILGEAEEGNKENKLDMKKTRKRLKCNNAIASEESDRRKNKIEVEDEKKKQKIGKRKRKSELEKAAGRGNLHELGNKAEDHFEKQNGKPKKSKKRKRERDTLNDNENIQEKRGESDQDEVYCISSGDEDCSKGMKKWLAEYHQSRPGLKVLQERIDEFITAHEEKLEQERKEKEALAAGDGWTVVVHHKGRKKTVDPESGIAVGSAAPVPAEYQITKKKHKEVGVNFYRFQRRDAQRKEQLALLSKFEQDKRRIQQLRAARKFQPY